MARTALAMALILLAAALPARAETCPQPSTPTATMTPAPRPDLRPDRQAAIRDALAARAYGAIALGDSIMEGWSEQRLSRDLGMPVLDAGFGQDGTEHVLWRLQAPDWRRQSPRIVLLLVGTNDIGYPACAIAWGIRTVAAKAQALFPQARILVTAILPRGTDMLGGDGRIRAVNAALAAAAASAGFAFFDPHDAFLCGHHTPCPLFQPDLNLHLTARGYDELDARLAAFLAGRGLEPR